jgi:acetylornithine/N-succinyldiaminopimelate aminotransferase
MKTEKIKSMEKEHVMQTYGRYDLVIDHGKGSYVYDKEGNKYLDFISGIACVPVGHANKEVSLAVSKQMDKLVQVSNLYYTSEQVVLASKLSKLSGLSKCFFCNSGAEANEAAVKLAKKITGKKKFIAFEESFHGRTTASLALTYKEKYKKPFLPLNPDVVFVKYNDIEALEKVITSDVAAVIIEPIQGEAGIVVPDAGYLKKVSLLCKKKKVLLIVDEVQTGNGRTGEYFAYLHEDIKPDIVTLAKGLANGIPIGVCISDYEFGKSEHASTFGGNSLSCAAANATIDYILDHKLMKNASKMGEYFMEELGKLGKSVVKVKGKGLMIGVELNSNKSKEVVLKCLKKGLLLNNVTENTLRFLPPLTITKKEVDEAVEILEEVLK